MKNKKGSKMNSPKSKARISFKSAFAKHQPAEKPSAIRVQLQKGSHAIGDAMEKVGGKMQKNGMPNMGKSMKMMGNKIEHMADK